MVRLSSPSGGCVVYWRTGCVLTPPEQPERSEGGEGGGGEPVEIGWMEPSQGFQPWPHSSIPGASPPLLGFASPERRWTENRVVPRTDATATITTATTDTLRKRSATVAPARPRRRRRPRPALPDHPPLVNLTPTLSRTFAVSKAAHSPAPAPKLRTLRTPIRPAPKARVSTPSDEAGLWDSDEGFELALSQLDDATVLSDKTNSSTELFLTAQPGTENWSASAEKLKRSNAGERRPSRTRAAAVTRATPAAVTRTKAPPQSKTLAPIHTTNTTKPPTLTTPSRTVRSASKEVARAEEPAAEKDQPRIAKPAYNLRGAPRELPLIVSSGNAKNLEQTISTELSFLESMEWTDDDLLSP